MRSILLRSIIFGLIATILFAVLTYFVANSYGPTGMDPTGNLLFLLFGWNVALAAYLSNEGWLLVIEPISLLCMLIYAFLFGWLVYSVLIFLVSLGIVRLQKR